MKDLRHLNVYRNSKGEEKLLSPGFRKSKVGIFDIPLKSGVTATVIADNGLNDAEWEHVSASTKTRCLTWTEMCEIKDLFFFEHETVIQYHPAKENYVNYHEYTLHLWRPKTKELPMPPKHLVY